MNQLVAEAFSDTLRMVPFLLVIYCVVEWVEHKYGETIQLRMRNAAKAGPLAGAVFGCVPQCGFSVLASAMYCRRFITIGTVLAVYLSTSDEAIPVILAQPDKATLVLPLLLTKFVIGLVGGYAADLFLRSYIKPHEHDHVDDHDCEDLVHETGCCEHDITDGKHKWQKLVHPLVHTAKVSAFLFLITLALGYIVERTGMTELNTLQAKHSIFEPALTALVGLIPNCAASVGITEMFLKNGISFGSAISGLCASGGLGVLVLLRENHNLRDTLRVLCLLLGISIAAGVIIQTIGWNPIIGR